MPSNRTLGHVKAIFDDAFFDPLPEAELGHLGAPKDGEASVTNNDVPNREPKSNSRSGSGFDDFLKDEGIFDEVHAKVFCVARPTPERNRPRGHTNADHYSTHAPTL